ncbi:DUF6808 domain-containing protein [Muribaculum intestinale]|uniref:DUF6808 domain-containing protein n=1 Tax=Muribaculum intestinale TaxID=1796646 RepID=UPI0026F3A2D0|nr:hypothetical protein [Muribaculum intestinale]
MKTKHYILLALAGLMAFFTGFFIGKDRTEKPPGTVTETKETTVDTILYCAPMPQSELALGTHCYILPTYRFLGGGSGGEPRCINADTTCCIDSVPTIRIYGTGAGGEPRCSNDSAIVELPIIQRHYADSTYEAWISGPVDPRLDSLRVFAPTTIITKREWKPHKRWHIGVTAGYGYGAKGFQPYIGVGITYSIFSF